MTGNEEERTVMNAVPEAADATVAFSPAAEGTLVIPAADRTQMSVSVECPVCHTTNLPGETYCGDCGFLLSGTPGDLAEDLAAPQARLTDANGREFPLNEGQNRVGRQGADVLLTDGSVSRQHAVIGLDNGHCWVEDSGSTNGTKVNGARLAAHQAQDLADGDEVTFGNVALRVCLPEGFLAVPAGEQAPVAGETPAEPDAAAATVFLVAEDTGAEYPLVTGATSIGRRSANKIAFPGDAYLSGRHAEVTFDGSTLVLTDLGSTNGTVVNDDKVPANTPTTLNDGDLVVMGQQRLRVRLGSGVAPAEEEIQFTLAEDEENEAG